jgi:hypothetical protein
MYFSFLVKGGRRHLATLNPHGAAAGRNAQPGARKQGLRLAGLPNMR